MTKVTILPLPTKDGDISYHALSGNKESIGKTVGEALDSLTSQLTYDEKGTMVIIQNHQPDQFFDVEQQKRLAQLMDEQRMVYKRGKELPDDKLSELKILVEAELKATAARATAIFEG